ncbi:hypothetical protein BBJ28_00001769 [Nothophytophthora sp. Chile5]|nr:hypothetical protein BBJ28_00001769 [Nothophytophthora sp. Chile5]
MDAFQMLPPSSDVQQRHLRQHPHNALIVRDNRQLQVYSAPISGSNYWQSQLTPTHEYGESHLHAGAAATLVGFTTADSRSASVDDDDSGDTGEEATAASRSPSPSASASPSKFTTKGTLGKKKRVFKKRKATHTIRKEQKTALEREIQELQVKLDAIKFQALVQRGEVSRTHQERAVKNAVLRESIQGQHLVMAQAQALLSGHTQHHLYGIRPMEMKICLRADRAERHEVLTALRGPKLREAMLFLQARSHGLDPTSTYFQEERFDTAEGDFCVTRFEVTPLRGVAGGVRAVFDAVLQNAFNAEIIISEISGHITIREDDDLNDDNVSQMRLVSQTSRGVLLENNLVHFAEFSPGKDTKDGEGGSYAVTATDFADEDELYPYRPHERVRRDTTAAMLVTSYMDTSQTSNGDRRSQFASEKQGELVVVVTRWSCSRVCHTDLQLPCHAQLELRNTSIRSANTFLNCVRETLGLPIVS